MVEPTGAIEDDPDLRDKKFPGNPSKSYRSVHPFKVVGEVTSWQGHSSEQVKAMKDGLAKLKEQGINSLNDQTIFLNAMKDREQIILNYLEGYNKRPCRQND